MTILTAKEIPIVPRDKLETSYANLKRQHNSSLAKVRRLQEPTHKEALEEAIDYHKDWIHYGDLSVKALRIVKYIISLRDTWDRLNHLILAKDNVQLRARGYLEVHILSQQDEEFFCRILNGEVFVERPWTPKEDNVVLDMDEMFFINRGWYMLEKAYELGRPAWQVNERFLFLRR